MDMRTLVMDLQKLLSTVQELVMSLNERFPVSQFLWIFDDLIENRLIFREFFCALIVILSFHHVFNSFPLVFVFLFL